ncbi:MAG TPA: SDR family NAD(P)-dependent oxidoreductase, partial [Gammaproteobacteria bacterium]|nr:SDR family NAD(P)-dependent oxidoreductase [Gammaproteobacteria bacterium]
MAKPESKTALIVGAGQGLSAALARLLAKEGMRIGLVSRDSSKLTALCAETGALPFDCDVTRLEQVQRLFEQADRRLPPLDLVVYNPGTRYPGPFTGLEPAEV